MDNSSSTLVLAAFGSLLLAVVMHRLVFGKANYEFASKHVLITGGSKGLGFSLAKQLAEQHKAQVTICCRTQTELDAAVDQVLALGGRIQGFVCDVTDNQACQDLVAMAEKGFGPVRVLINCAGRAVPGLFNDQPVEAIESTMRLNFLGSVFPTKVVVSNAVKRHREDPQLEHKIVFVASQAGLMSMVGYSSYSPSKFAVRGLAESLRNELLPHGISVSIAYPGNMDTPGYEEEMKAKPEATKQIEAMESLQNTEDVARALIHSMAKHEFAMYGGNLSGYFLGRMAHGLAPNGNVLVWDAVLAPFLVFAAYAHRVLILDRTVWKAHRG
ncbi:hypothetical protein BASA81_012118 [Batrachochytrium salamandrivorans]|nr:hypothetical protein BASA81_012118 [Batrachochytrium salamandrivorans]